MPTGNVYVDTLVWGGAWTPTLKRGITLNWTSANSSGEFAALTWTGEEIGALNAALQKWANVADISLRTDASQPMDLVYYKVSGSTMASITGSSQVLGFHNTPDGSNRTPLKGVFNGDAFFTANLSVGSDGFVTLVHEIGHGLGLAHPHDGGGSGEIFPGVSSSSDLGTNSLNQQIFSIMSYNVGWADQPPSGSLLTGGVQGPMALDIAAIQAVYGANRTYQAGSDSYVLPQTDVTGTGWSCLWDVSGSDTISNAGSSVSCTIDLRDAPLTGANAGGYVSWVQGVPGGYTIANGVVIETAIGGNASDQLIGNSSANYLDGRLGADGMSGGLGNDTYLVDDVGDVVTETVAAVSGGTDLVLSSVNFLLPDNVEHLTLTGIQDISATGNALANMLIGNSGSNVLDGSAGVDSLSGQGGDDVYHVDLEFIAGKARLQDTVIESDSSGTDTLVLRSSSSVSSAVIFAAPLNFENVDASSTGTLLLNLTGNSLSNSLSGNSASNVLDGGAGDDTLAGGDGNDTYVVDSSSDLAVELQAAGTDTVRSAASSFVLGDNLENLILGEITAKTGDGNSLDNQMTGNRVANTLRGLAGNDRLDGGLGDDILIGGLGDDTYVVDSINDSVVEQSGEGVDEVQTYVSYTLAANLENLTLLSNLTINGTGNALDNVIVGNTRSNILDGGAGADLLQGGRGGDTYIVDNSGDVVVESESGPVGGIDLVKSSVDFTLGANIEHLTLTGTGHINGTGNDLNNTLIGNVGNNILDGGTGTDMLRGGKGNDTYLVDLYSSGSQLRLQDVVYEEKDGGTDTIVLRADPGLVLASAGTLVVAPNIENIDISGTTGLLLNLTGNGLNNVLTGNSAANRLDGGVGLDVLVGGVGDDLYLVDNVGDQIVEVAGEGTDSVRSTAYGYSLSDYVENLTLIGTSARNGSGNSGDNILVGNGVGNTLDGGAGNDTLSGGLGLDILLGGPGNDVLIGGGGKDVLTGGAGNDRFVFDVRPNAQTNVDRIEDFSPGEDVLALDTTIFTALASIGAVGADNFVVGTKALDENDFLIYNAGHLFYDPDGSGQKFQTEVVYLTGTPSLAYTSFDLFS